MNEKLKKRLQICSLFIQVEDAQESITMLEMLHNNAQVEGKYDLVQKLFAIIQLLDLSEFDKAVEAIHALIGSL